jgi:hypothetical protein
MNAMDPQPLDVQDSGGVIDADAHVSTGPNGAESERIMQALRFLSKKQVLYRPQQPLTQPQAPWTDFSMDFNHLSTPELK